MNGLQTHHTKAPVPAQADESQNDVLKWHHRLARLELRKTQDGQLALINPWGQVIETFPPNYLSPHPIWEAADREIARGYLRR